MTSPLRTFLSVCAAACVVSFAAPALAADPAAEAVFDEGLKAYEAGDHATACPKLETAVKLTKGEGLGGTLLLAECWEKVGRTASAWGLYRTVAARAAATKQEERRTKAQAGEQRLVPLLHRVELVVAPQVASIAGVVIERGGEPVPREAWGVALPVDPGPLLVRATAPGHAPFDTRVEVPRTPGGTKVAIDALQPFAGGASAVPPPPLTGQPSTPPPATDDGGGLGGLGVAGLVLGGVGAATMAVSVVLGVVAEGQWAEAHGPSCSGNVCTDPADVEAVNDTRSLAHVGTGVFIAGAVVAAAGGTMLVIDLAGGSNRDAAGVPSPLRLGVGPGGVSAEGAF